jgi:putative phosphoribosyl transferase
MYNTQFLNRETAGMELAGVLKLQIQDDMIVIGMPDGGASVAAAAARYLQVPLYPILVRKLGIPGHDNLSMGALAPKGTEWLDHELIDQLGITEAAVQKIVRREALQLQRSEQMHPNDCNFGLIAGRTAVIVDDGIPDNTHNILAAVEFVRRQKPQQLLIAAPVVSAAAAVSLADKCEGLICLYKPDMFIAADYWYEQKTIVPGARN